MPYPDDFSGDRFDQHYGTDDEDDEPQEKPMENVKDIAWTSKNKDMHIAAISAQPGDKFALSVEYHRPGDGAYDIAEILVPRRVMEELRDAITQTLDATKQVIS